MSREHDERSMGTADLVAGAETARETQGEMRNDARSDMRNPDMRNPDGMDRMPRGDMAAQPGQMGQAQQQPAGEPLAALFDANVAQDFHKRWNDVQIGFVDDPRRAVQHADELVAQVMKSLAESFARQRSAIEGGVSGEGSGQTEELRVALRRYRSFFERLLTL